MRASGAGRIKVFFYGIQPLASRAVQSFTLMRAECAIRNAAVIGAVGGGGGWRRWVEAVGGGGLGAEIWYQIRFGVWDKVSTLILCTLALTLTADLASSYIRRQLRSDPNHPRAVKAHSVFADLSRAWIGSGFAVLIVVWSVWFMGWGNSAGPNGAPKNFLEPAAEILSGEAWGRLSFFERLLRPNMALAALGLGDPEQVEAREAAGQTVSLFQEYPPWHFYRAAAWSAWEQELDQWFVWRVIKSSSVPLAMAIVGTLLGVLGAMALTYPHTLAFQLEPAQFSGESTHPLVRAIDDWRNFDRDVGGLIAKGVTGR